MKEEIKNEPNIVVCGREFKPVGNSTLRHDLATQREIYRAGLEGMKIEPGETAPMFAMRVMRTACMKGDVLSLLGCLLMPAKEEKWTPAIAEETTEFFAELDDQEDKRKVQSQINSVLFSFMQAGLLSLITSTRSSLLAEEETEEQNRSSESAASPSMADGRN